MLCPNCKKEILDDSVFCQYCGSTIPEEEKTLRCPKCHQVLPEDSEFCQFCGTTITHNNTMAKSSIIKEKHQSPVIKKNDNMSLFAAYPIEEKSKKKNKLLTTVLIIVAALAVVFAGLNVFQFIKNKNNNQLLTSYESQLQEKDDRIKSINAQLSTANSKANNYDSLVSALGNKSYGYATNYFHVSQGVFVLYTGESKTITLTAALGGDVMITTSTDNFNIADVTFNEESWMGDYTTLTVQAKKLKGITRITFTNSFDSSFFEILVIVI